MRARGGQVIRRTLELAMSRSARVVSLVIVQALLGSVFAVLSARWLGPTDRGVVVLVSVLGSLLMLVGSLGVATGGRMLLSTNDPAYALGTHVAVTWRLCTLHILTVSFIGWPLLVVSDGWRGWSTGTAFLVYAVLMLVVYLLREGLHGVGRHSLATSADLLLVSVQVLGALCLQLFHRVSLEGFLWLMAVAATLEVLFLLVCYRRSVAGTIVRSPVTTRQLVRLSAPALAGVLGQAFALRGDRVLLGVFGDPRSVGLYGTAATFSEMLLLVPLGLSQVVFRHSGQGNHQIISRIRRFNWAISIFMAAACALLAEPVVLLLLGQAYADAIPLIYFLIAGGIPLAGYYLESAVCNGAGDFHGPAKAAGIGSLLLAVGCVALIPEFGARGAAVSSIVAYGSMALFLAKRTRKRQQRDLPDGVLRG